MARSSEKSKSTGYRRESEYADAYVLDLTPLDIIKQDTDVLADDIEYAFRLPSAPLEIADYFGHYFLPAEKAA